MIGTPSVLIVDDETEFATTLKKRLQKRGINSACAFNATDGLRMAQESDFDIVVFDVRLPDINGIEAVGRLKAARPDTQIIILTGHASAISGREGLQAGAADYVLKPVEFEALLEKIISLYQKTCAASVRGSPT